jgi:TolB-like protein/DNA-binding winged helix-turn-helix (wHTH) protein/Tfp pilus assembly protein PilF
VDSRGAQFLQIGSGRFDPVSGELSLNGRSTRLRPRTAALLSYLISHRGRIIGKDELLQAIWPKVVVTEDSIVQCVKEIRRALGRERHDWIRTVPREGYAYVAAPEDAAGVPSTTTERSSRSRVALSVAAVVLASCIVAVALLSRSDHAIDRPPLSLVVLPVANLTGDPVHENDADEMTEGLARSLSRLPGAFVIAPSTAFTFKGKAVDVRRVGSDLGVRYVLEGALRLQGSRLQLTASMADSTNARQLWSETFEAPTQGAIELHNDALMRVAGSLGLRLVHLEAQRSQREKGPPDATALLIRARAALRWAGQGEEGVVEARQLLEEAVRRDDGLAEAWALLAWTYLDEIRFRPGREEDLVRAAHAVDRAIALAPESADALGAKARLQYNRAQMPQALSSFQQAIQLNPSDAQWHGHSAATLIMLGRPEEALAASDRAIRLSPHDPQLSLWQMFEGVALLHLGRDDEAIERLTKAVADNPKSAFGRLFLASALGNAGRVDEAGIQIQELLRLRPGLTLTQFKSREPSDEPRFLAHRQRVYQGLRRAGLPD